MYKRGPLRARDRVKSSFGTHCCAGEVPRCTKASSTLASRGGPRLASSCTPDREKLQRRTHDDAITWPLKTWPNRPLLRLLLLLLLRLLRALGVFELPRGRTRGNGARTGPWRRGGAAARRRGGTPSSSYYTMFIVVYGKRAQLNYEWMNEWNETEITFSHVQPCTHTRSYADLYPRRPEKQIQNKILLKNCIIIWLFIKSVKETNRISVRRENWMKQL